MTSTMSRSSGYAIARCVDLTDTPKARYFRLTFPEPGRCILKIGNGDHTCDSWELDRDQLRGFILDGLPVLLK